MREFYFVVSPVERRPEKNIRVFSVEKTRKEQGNYKESARMAEGYSKAEERKNFQKTVDENIEYRKDGDLQKNGAEMLQPELLKGCDISLRERQEQMQYRKRVQETSSRRHQMLAAYGKE